MGRVYLRRWLTFASAFVDGMSFCSEPPEGVKGRSRLVDYSSDGDRYGWGVCIAVMKSGAFDTLHTRDGGLAFDHTSVVRGKVKLVNYANSTTHVNNHMDKECFVQKYVEQQKAYLSVYRPVDDDPRVLALQGSPTRETEFGFDTPVLRPRKPRSSPSDKDSNKENEATRKQLPGRVKRKKAPSSDVERVARKSVASINVFIHLTTPAMDRTR